MKKTLLLLAVAFSIMSGGLQAQCVRDSSLLLNDTVFISPQPYTAAHPVYGLAVACINHPYTQSVTIKVPTQFVFQGINLPLTNASLATTGAISGLPTGISYVCDPPNCVFNASTLGCILLTGTPSNPAQAPDTLDLSITASVLTAFGPFAITFPGPIAPGNYYLVLQTAANCTSASDEPNTPFSSIKNTPNPFADQTVISLQSLQPGNFKFEVFNMLGKRVYAQPIRLEEGSNQFTFMANDLPNGAYYFVLGNAEGKVSHKMIIAR